MLRKILCAPVAGALIALTLLAVSSPREAKAGQPDLFFNFYSQPNRCGGVPAQLYISPLPVPPHVGHTYITYQPLMPNEYLYKHKRVYYRYHPDGGHTVTRVWWY